MKFWPFTNRPETEPVSDLDPLADYTADDLQAVALDIIGVPPHAFDSDGISRCDECDARLAELREKYAAYEPPRLRAAIFDWIAWGQQRNDEARASILSGARKRRMAEYEAQRVEKRERVREIKDRLGIR